ncbi:MAG: HDIG domain-containing metalloprotein [Caldisericaceae bacterium]
MEREELLQELKKRLKEDNIIKHLLATEAVMKSLAIHFSENADLWGIAGLTHDIDYDSTSHSLKRHGIEGAKVLQDLGLDERIVYAVKAHNPVLNLPRNSKLDKALYAADPVTGLITACALVKGKRLSNVSLDFLIKRFKEKRFAEGANREQIASCSDIGLSLEEFLNLSLDAMKNISEELGL